jgi:uncharacterized tellurite resistance protein B-like protein
MFDAFRNFVAEFVDGDRHPSQFADDDYRHRRRYVADRARKLHGIVKRRFGLDDGAADELIDKATVAEHEAVDLYHFTSLLNRTLDEDGRARVVEMMWEIVYADGWRDELEDNLLWRAADLLGVSPRQRIELRQRIAKAVGEPGEA